MLHVLDSYLAWQMARRWAVIVAVIVSILSLENLGRLAHSVEQTATPVRLLAGLMATLIPEYLGVAIPLATYLAVALTVRALSHRGEWQMLEALGVRPARYMLVPMLLALLSAGMQLAIRLELQPRGETALDRLSNDLRRGLYGSAFTPGQIMQLDARTILIADRDPSHRPGELRNVFLEHDGDIVDSERAMLGLSEEGVFSITLIAGRLVRRDPNGTRKTMAFARYTLLLGSPPMPLLRPADALDRLPFAQLRAQATRESGHGPSTAALVARTASALFCLLLPWLGLAFGEEPPRQSGSPGIFVGLLAIVAFLKTSDFVQQDFAHSPILAGSVHLAAWVAVTTAIWRFARGLDWDRAARRLLQIPPRSP